MSSECSRGQTYTRCLSDLSRLEQSNFKEMIDLRNLKEDLCRNAKLFETLNDDQVRRNGCVLFFVPATWAFDPKTSKSCSGHLGRSDIQDVG